MANSTDVPNQGGKGQSQQSASGAGSSRGQRTARRYTPVPPHSLPLPQASVLNHLSAEAGMSYIKPARQKMPGG